MIKKYVNFNEVTDRSTRLYRQSIILNWGTGIATTRVGDSVRSQRFLAKLACAPLVPFLRVKLLVCTITIDFFEGTKSDVYHSIITKWWLRRLDGRKQEFT